MIKRVMLKLFPNGEFTSAELANTPIEWMDIYDPTAAKKEEDTPDPDDQNQGSQTGQDNQNQGGQWYQWIQAHCKHYDQVILERNKAGKYWLHVSSRRQLHMNRHQAFFMTRS